MNKLLPYARETWPAWMIVFFFAALPFQRWIELAIVVFFFWLILVAWHDDESRRRIRCMAPLVIPLFLCIWLPILFSAFDSYRETKTWSMVAAYLRYPVAALCIGALLWNPRLRAIAMAGVTWVLLFWAVDGYVQLVFGRDIFGFELHPDRLAALFGDHKAFYGTLLATLSPIALEHARRHWKPWAWLVCFTLICGAVIISGIRAGWLTMGMVTVYYLWRFLRDSDPVMKRLAMFTPAVILALSILAYLASDVVRQRVDDSVGGLQGSEQALEEASTFRVSIWRAALAMYQAHPINGVGARAYSVAYYDFAPKDDFHIWLNPDGNGGAYAHNVVLEAMSETGTIGLLGLLLAYWLAWRAWRMATPQSREEALPWVFPLALLMFPLNSHLSMYGVTVSTLIFVLIGLWAAAWRREQPETPAQS